MIKVLFVCLGNICRSPMAEFVLKQMVAEKGLADKFEIDSAATEGYNEMCHAGIHHGTRQMLKSMHIPFEEHYSRRIRPWQWMTAILKTFNHWSAWIPNTKSIVCWILQTIRATLKIRGTPGILTRLTGISLRAARLF